MLTDKKGRCCSDNGSCGHYPESLKVTEIEINSYLINTLKETIHRGDSYRTMINGNVVIFKTKYAT